MGKTRQNIFGLENDVFICVTYAAPENSQVHTTYIQSVKIIV